MWIPLLKKLSLQKLLLLTLKPQLSWNFTLLLLKTIMTSLGQADKAQVIAILSPSAHPGAWVAARGFASEVFVLTRRHHPHAKIHGLVLGKALRRAEILPASTGVSAVPSCSGERLTIKGF